MSRELSPSRFGTQPRRRPNSIVLLVGFQLAGLCEYLLGSAFPGSLVSEGSYGTSCHDQAVLPGFTVYIAALIGVFGVLGYVRDTFRGNSFPHRITWFLWGLIPLVTLVVQLRAHVGVQAVMTFSYFVTPMAVLVVSFVARRGSWAITAFDWACGGVCLTAIAVYAATLRGDLAIGLLLTAEFFAARADRAQVLEGTRDRDLDGLSSPGSRAR